MYLSIFVHYLNAPKIETIITLANNKKKSKYFLMSLFTKKGLNLNLIRIKWFLNGLNFEKGKILFEVNNSLED